MHIKARMLFLLFFFKFGLGFRNWYVDLSWVAYAGFAMWKASEIFK